MNVSWVQNDANQFGLYLYLSPAAHRFMPRHQALTQTQLAPALCLEADGWLDDGGSTKSKENSLNLMLAMAQLRKTSCSRWRPLGLAWAESFRKLEPSASRTALAEARAFKPSGGMNEDLGRGGSQL